MAGILLHKALKSDTAPSAGFQSSAPFLKSSGRFGFLEERKNSLRKSLGIRREGIVALVGNFYQLAGRDAPLNLSRVLDEPFI
jgi:hypothetical protein